MSGVDVKRPLRIATRDDEAGEKPTTPEPCAAKSALPQANCIASVAAAGRLAFWPRRLASVRQQRLRLRDLRKFQRRRKPLQRRP
jgi:hypothetical protein